MPLDIHMDLGGTRYPAVHLRRPARRPPPRVCPREEPVYGFCPRPPAALLGAWVAEGNLIADEQ
eukprot:1588631-Heterocapsa_arctica.AAC.1